MAQRSAQTDDKRALIYPSTLNESTDIMTQVYKRSNVAGRTHEGLSRQKLTHERDESRQSALDATKKSDVYNATLRADRKAGALKVRNAFSVMTAPLDFAFGTCRNRPEYSGKPRDGADAVNRLFGHFCDGGVLPLGLTLLAAWGALGAGVVGGTVGWPLGVVTGNVTRGVTTGIKVVSFPVGLALGGMTGVIAQFAAMPSAGLKGLGTAIGSAGGTLYGYAHARRRARAFAAAPQPRALRNASQPMHNGPLSA